MQSIAASPIATCTGRDLIRIPAYTRVLNALYGLRDSLQVYVLWRDVFGENLLGSGQSGWYLEWEFFNRVNDELFPLDLAVLSELYYNYADEPMNVPIPVAGLRVPWEAVAVEDLPGYQQMVAMAIFENYEPPDYDLGALGDDELEYGIAWLAGGDEAEAALERLSSQGDPWDGLADLVRIAIRQEPTTNPFLDWPDDAHWLLEYAYNDFYWTAEDIRHLAGEYDRVRDVAARIRAFKNWYIIQPDPSLANQVIFERLRDARGD